MLPQGRGVLAVLACAIVACFYAPAAHAAPLADQGMYESCDPATAVERCVDRLQKMASAGFKVVMNGSIPRATTTAEDVLSYGQAAQALGMEVMLNLRVGWNAPASERGLLDQYPGLALTCGCVDNAGLLAYYVGLLQAQPWFWGYYIADEPRVADHDALAAWNERLKALDPAHPRLLMGCGLCGPDPGVKDFTDLDVVLATDRYPVFDGRPDPAAARTSVSWVSGQLRRIAEREGHKTAVAIQSWSWGDSKFDSEALGMDPASLRFPTVAEMRGMRNGAMEADPEVILWWTFTQVHGWEPADALSYWTQPDDADARWKALVEAAFGDQVAKPAAKRPVKKSRSERRKSRRAKAERAKARRAKARRAAARQLA
jgi:hypothetical protein